MAGQRDTLAHPREACHSVGMTRLFSVSCGQPWLVATFPASQRMLSWSINRPGFVDAHRHAWEGQLRGLLPKSSIGDYMAQTHRGFAPFYRPEDMYVGNLISALGALDAGIRPPTLHTDRPIEALAGSPFRLLTAAEPWVGPRRAAVSDRSR